MSYKVQTYTGLTEKISRILSGFESMPPMEKAKMIKRAAKAAETYTTQLLKDARTVAEFIKIPRGSYNEAQEAADRILGIQTTKCPECSGNGYKYTLDSEGDPVGSPCPECQKDGQP